MHAISVGDVQETFGVSEQNRANDHCGSVSILAPPVNEDVPGTSAVRDENELSNSSPVTPPGRGSKPLVVHRTRRSSSVGSRSSGSARKPAKKRKSALDTDVSDGGKGHAAVPSSDSEVESSKPGTSGGATNPVKDFVAMFGSPGYLLSN